MRKAIQYDKDKVVDIISKTFDKNPEVIGMLKNGGNHKKSIKLQTDRQLAEKFVLLPFMYFIKDEISIIKRTLRA